MSLLHFSMRLIGTAGWEVVFVQRSRSWWYLHCIKPYNSICRYCCQWRTNQSSFRPVVWVFPVQAPADVIELVHIAVIVDLGLCICTHLHATVQGNLRVVSDCTRRSTVTRVGTGKVLQLYTHSCLACLPHFHGLGKASIRKW